jgi:hypothetical protein
LQEISRHYMYCNATGITWSTDVTKLQARQSDQARKACALGMPDLAARILSALHRSAMRANDKREIESQARELGVTSQPDWIICG